MKHLIATILSVVAIGAMAEESLTFAGSFDSTGCFDAMGTEATKSVSVEYKYESDTLDVSAYGTRKPKGSNCREYGVALDINIERQWQAGEIGYATVNLGFVQHGLTALDSNDKIIFGNVRTEIASFGVGRKVAGVELSVSFNVPNRKPLFAAKTELLGVDLSADYLDGFKNAVASYSVPISEKWDFAITGRHSSGMENLPDPFNGMAAPSATKTNTLEFGVKYVW